MTYLTKITDLTKTTNLTKMVYSTKMTNLTKMTYSTKNSSHKNSELDERANFTKNLRISQTYY